MLTAKLMLEYLNFVDLLICVSVLLVLKKKDLISDYRSFAIYMCVRICSAGIAIPLLFFRKELHISKSIVYLIYYYSTWPILISEAVLMVAMVYGIYGLALKPFEPLRRLGTIIFRWVATVSVIVSAGLAIGPHMFGAEYGAKLVGQIQQSASVLTLCLLFFVCLALRPLGLTPRSRLFGASMGLGILATMQLVQSAWLPTTAALSVYSPVYVYSGLAACVALLVWGAYFLLPERKNRMVLLPTTSPYFLWNKISEALGDSPGYVVVNGFSPESFAPGELDALVSAGRTLPSPVTHVQALQPITLNR